jgi:DNA-binding SARP family transcriptional activator/Flp pilus assembly protein TadD
LPTVTPKTQVSDTIQLRALGVLDLRNGDGEELRQVLAQPKRAALLTYLALAAPRASHPRDKLLGLFWPDQDSESARNALSQAVHFLRRALGDDVIVSQNGDSLGVAPARIWCDAIAFEDAIRQARMEEALALYRGDFLEGFHIANAPDFERWLDQERQRFGERFDAALETIAVQRELQGDHAGALSHRRRLAARAPFNSAIALRLMRALSMSGDAAAAVQYAQLHEKLLRSELDMALPADITTFVAELQARPPLPPGVARPVTERIGQADLRPVQAEQSEDGKKPLVEQRRRRRVAIVTAALVLAFAGVSYAVVNRRMPAAAYVRHLYVQGRAAGINRSLIGVQTAAGYYRQAIERDSGFALGYAGLSLAYAHMAAYDFAPAGAALDSARVLSQRGVELDSTLAETRTALAVSLANSGHFGAAEREFRSAITLDPNNSDARYWYALLLVALGRGKDALAQADRALALDSLAPRAALGAKRMATYLITNRRDYIKLPLAERRPILKVELGEPWARARQALELADEGRCPEALSDISFARRLVQDDNMPMLAFAGAVHWSCGDRVRARALLAQMKRRSDRREHGLDIAILHTRFGEKDSAFAWLQHQRWTVGNLAMLSAAPFVDSLRSDPQFPRLMRQLGIR